MARRETSAESPQMQEIIDATKQISQPLQAELPSPTPIAISVEPVEPVAQTKYASAYYKSAKISHCSECGEKRRTDTAGKHFCPVQNHNCSFVK